MKKYLLKLFLTLRERTCLTLNWVSHLRLHPKKSRAKIIYVFEEKFFLLHQKQLKVENIKQLIK